MPNPTLKEEKALWNKGFKYVCGIDEVGRGALAGPVVAAAVVLEPNTRLTTLYKSVRDSKLLTPKRREELDKALRNTVLEYSVGEAEHKIVNEHGIVHATEVAMVRAIEGLNVKVDFHIIDYFKIKSLPTEIQKPIKSGDRISVSIAAASIIAKVHRDKLMAKKYHKEYPKYSFHRHKGYGTKLHQDAIKKNGLSPIHRTQFVPSQLLLS